MKDFLGGVIGALEASEIPYMLTGSLASSFHGSPRATQDIDLVVSAELEPLLSLAKGLQDLGYYVSKEAVTEASELRGQFNCIDPESGWKADFIIRKNRPFSRSEFDRRVPVEFLELKLSIARPEDLVVAKLEWAKLGDSERQLRDVREILQIQGDEFDRSMVEGWLDELGVRSQWEKVIASLPDESLT